MEISDETVENLLKAIGAFVGFILGAIFLSFFVFLIPLWKIYKHNRALKIYGFFLVIVGLLLFYDPIAGWVKLYFLEKIFNMIPERFSWHFILKILGAFKNGFEFQLEIAPELFSLVGFACIFKGTLGDMKKSEEKITFKGTKNYDWKDYYEYRLDDIFKDETNDKKLKKYGDKCFIGIDKKTGKKEYLSDSELEGQSAIFGATRTGKTGHLIYPILMNHIRRGHPCVFADPKGDDQFLSLYKFLKKYNLHKKIKFFSIDRPEISVPYNPLARGNILQQTNRVMAAFEWENKFYENQCRQALLYYLSRFKEKNMIPTLPELFQIFKAENDDKTTGMVANLSQFVYSEYAELLDHGDSLIDFEKAQKNKEIIYIQVNTNSYLHASKSIIKFMLLDLKYASNQVQMNEGRGNLMPIFIDEFGDFVLEGFDSYFKQCASSGHCLFLAAQSFGDLRNHGIEDMVVSNTQNQFILRQRYPDNADMAAKICGSFTTTRETEQFEDDKSTGIKALREVEMLRLDPNVVKKLGAGMGVFTSKDRLHFLDLPISPFFTKDGSPYVSDREKKALLKEIKSNRIFPPKRSAVPFNPNDFLMRRDSTSPPSKGRKFRKERNVEC